MPIILAVLFDSFSVLWILHGAARPRLKIRQDAAGRLFVTDYYEVVEGESPEDRAATTLALIRRRFRGAGNRHANRCPSRMPTPTPRPAAGGFACIEPDEPATQGWMVSVWADGPGNATRVRLMAVESARSVLRAANPGFPDIAVTSADETMMYAMAVFVGRAVRSATPRHTTAVAARSGRSRLPRPVAGWGNPVVTGR